MTGAYQFSVLRKVFSWLPIGRRIDLDSNGDLTWAEAYEVAQKVARLKRVVLVQVKRPDGTVVVYGKDGQRLV